MNAIARPALARHFHRIAWLAVALTACVVVFGAFVRLSDAGLSCPDWPTCYGKAAWPTHAEQVAGHAAVDIRPVDPSKAWREQFHRMIAGTLGVLVLALALLATRRRPHGWAQVLGAAAAVAIADRILATGDASDYLRFLTTGGSDYPIKELRIAGVDLEKPEVVSNALKEFGNSVDELEKLLGQLK